MKKNRRSKIGSLRLALLELLEEHERDNALPTSARFLFYELVQRGILSKQRKTQGRRPDQNISDALTDLRERGDVPWDWIVDETRSLDDSRGASTLREWMLDVLPGARLDPWAGNVPLILTESRSLAGVLRRLVDDYAVLIAATNGQVGGFLHTEIIPILRPRQQILYLGDLDLSGSQIEDNTRRASATKLVPDRPGELTAESCCGEGTPEMRRQVCKSNRRVTFGVSTEFHRRRLSSVYVSPRPQAADLKTRDV